MWYFVPPEDFFKYIANWQDHLVLVGAVALIAGFLIYDVVWMAENFCVYICPYVRIQSALIDNNTVLEIYDEKRGGKIYEHTQDSTIKIADKPSEGDCIGCMACVKVCPTHIDIRNGPGQLECINCLECSDACAPIMAGLGKENLINWTSPNAMVGQKPSLLRFKVIAYLAVMAACIVAVLVIGSKKETMLLNINRTSQLYMVKDDGKTVENAYEFLFENTDSKKHDFYFEVLNDPSVKIVKPDHAFDLGAGKMVKKVVVLSTDNLASAKEHEDTITHLKVRAYAVDDNKTIFVFREAVFILPGKNTIEKSSK
jgi:cytochrome c oxidase accessory protein FixG